MKEGAYLAILLSKVRRTVLATTRGIDLTGPLAIIGLDPDGECLCAAPPLSELSASPLSAPAHAQTSPPLRQAPCRLREIRELLDAAKATAKASRENVDYSRVVPDILYQILAKLDKVETKLDKIENDLKARHQETVQSQESGSVGVPRYTVTRAISPNVNGSPACWPASQPTFSRVAMLTKRNVQQPEGITEERLERALEVLSALVSEHGEKHAPLAHDDREDSSPTCAPARTRAVAGRRPTRRRAERLEDSPTQ